MGFLEALTLVFIALKLFGIITWSWWLVVMPMYPAILIYILIMFVGASIFSLFKRR